MSASYGIFHRIPASLPFTLTLAVSRTSPSDRSTLRFFEIKSSGMSKDLLYFAVPEKYFMPNSGRSVHDTSLSKAISPSGAPRSLANSTLQSDDNFIGRGRFSTFVENFAPSDSSPSAEPLISNTMAGAPSSTVGYIDCGGIHSRPFQKWFSLSFTIASVSRLPTLYLI